LGVSGVFSLSISLGRVGGTTGCGATGVGTFTVNGLLIFSSSR
jgi:hypothetical protein